MIIPVQLSERSRIFSEPARSNQAGKKNKQRIQRIATDREGGEEKGFRPARSPKRVCFAIAEEDVEKWTIRAIGQSSNR
jgi:hypothetical protein